LCLPLSSNVSSDTAIPDADDDEETANLILTAIKGRVAQRNKVNADRMRAGNAVPADQIFARNAIVTLLIPKQLRLAGELRRILCRVIQHTRAGYQLNTKWGLLSGRFAHCGIWRKVR
jgi:hypothetical protein